MAGPRQGKRIEGAGKGARILIVEARFYDAIADALLAGAMKALKEAKAEVDVISVPGALEIPTAIAIAPTPRSASANLMTARSDSAA
jgi:6,7-dimethyl-8-ribityllumazine synthase